MLRYVAALWDGKDREATREAEQLLRRFRAVLDSWQSVIDANGMFVLCSTDGKASRIAPVDGSPTAFGAVVGQLFAKRSEGPSAQILDLRGHDARAIISTQGQHLIQNYWGRYVAFAHHSHSCASWIMRDPTGGLPCYTRMHGRLSLFFSRIEDLLQIDGLSFQLDWEYAEAKLLLGRTYGARTGIHDVTEVVPGNRIELSGRCRRSSTCWSAAMVAAQEPIEDPNAAQLILRTTTRACVHSWASCYGGVVVRLSGGLDSSIVLSCLRDAPTNPKIVALNYYSPGSDGDERSFARLSADRAQVHLIERPRDATLRLDAILEVPRTTIPHFYFAYLENSRNEAILAQETGCSAIWTGGGGDQLFYQTQARLAAADFFHVHGPTAEFFRVALDSARLERDSIWRVLGEAVGRRFRRHPWSPFEMPGTRALVPPDISIQIAKREAASYFAQPATLAHLSGKAFQIDTLSLPPRFYDPLGKPNDPEPLEPLANSQPIQEVCLRIPTYLHTKGGVDRAIARRAFAQDVPQQIVRRRTKGGLEEHAKTVLALNLPFIRGLLLEGALVRRGLLDRRKLEEFLSNSPSKLSSSMAELYDLMSLEAWLHAWTTHELRQVA